jgi:hypothetical protein
MGVNQERLGQKGLDALNNVRWFLEAVFPNAKNGPTLTPERASHFCVTTFVALYFRHPIIATGFRHPAMPPATVPKASVHKNRKPLPVENEVWITGNFLTSPPADDSVSAKNGNQFEFGCLVSS